VHPGTPVTGGPQRAKSIDVKKQQMRSKPRLVATDCWFELAHCDASAFLQRIAQLGEPLLCQGCGFSDAAAIFTPSGTSWT
jgi:hypothetical protein